VTSYIVRAREATDASAMQGYECRCCARRSRVV